MSDRIKRVGPLAETLWFWGKGEANLGEGFAKYREGGKRLGESRVAIQEGITNDGEHRSGRREWERPSLIGGSTGRGVWGKVHRATARGENWIGGGPCDRTTHHQVPCLSKTGSHGKGGG